MNSCSKALGRCLRGRKFLICILICNGEDKCQKSEFENKKGTSPELFYNELSQEDSRFIKAKKA